MSKLNYVCYERVWVRSEHVHFRFLQLSQTNFICLFFTKQMLICAVNFTKNVNFSFFVNFTAEIKNNCRYNCCKLISCAYFSRKIADFCRKFYEKRKFYVFRKFLKCVPTHRKFYVFRKISRMGRSPISEILVEQTKI